MKIDPAASMPLYRQLSDELRRQVSTGGLRPGTRLPPYRALVEAYGVSLMTVNKALSVLISEGTLYSRVGSGTYVADRTAAARRNPLALVVPHLAGPLAPGLHDAVRREAARAGHGLVLALDGEEDGAHRLRDLQELGIGGLILASPDPAPRVVEAVRGLHAAGLPAVFLAPVPGGSVPSVEIDHAASGFLATLHLLRTGRRRVGIVAGGRAADLHRRGHLRALERYGRERESELEWTASPASPEDAYRAGCAVGRQIAAAGSRPDALLVADGSTACGVIDALLDAGIEVPGEVAVVGIGPLPYGEHVRVPLTAVCPPAGEMARLAVDALVRRARNEGPLPPRRLVPELQVRSSCGAHLASFPRLVA